MSSIGLFSRERALAHFQFLENGFRVEVIDAVLIGKLVRKGEVGISR